MTSIELANDIASAYNSTWEIVQGNINTVALTSNVVVKVPADQAEWRLAALDREQNILRLLGEADFQPYSKPELIEYSQDPTYLVTTYVPGVAMTTESIRRMSNRERQTVGHSLGAYILAQTAATGSVDITEAMMALPTRDRTSEFENVGTFFEPEQYPTLTKTCQTLFERWQSFKSADVPQHFIHGDLTPHNIISAKGHVAGAIDFARAHIGTIAEELSTVCDTDTVVFESCARELQQGGMTAVAEHARTWRDMKYLHVGPLLIQSEEPNSQGRAVFKEVIEAMYPDLNWQEL